LEFLETDLQNLKRSISNDIFEDLDSFRGELDKLKTKFLDHGPKFSGRLEIFQEVQLTLIAKAADYLVISSRKESDHSVKRLQDRLSELQLQTNSQLEEARREHQRLNGKLVETE